MISIDGVSKTYEKGSKPVIENLSFDVMPGKIHGIIGPNGSGKTTLIKCITGIFHVDSGSITLDGEDVFDNPATKKRIGYVADNCNFFPSFRVKKLVKFYEGMFEDFNVEDFNKMNEVFQIPLKKKIGHLSKGQKMRTSFMLNMAMNPDVLVLDEPTSGLDAIAKADLLEQIITKVEYDEMSVIISTHHLNEIEKICDTVTMLNAEGVYFQGEIDSAKEKIHKYQVVFKNGISKGVLSDPRILNYSNIGSVFTFLWSGGEDAVSYFEDHGADLVEQTEISLEELFIYSNRRRDTDE